MSELEKIPPMMFTGHTWADEHRLPPIKATTGDGRLPVEPKVVRCEQCNGVQSLVYEYCGGTLGSVTPTMPTGPYPAQENGANIAYPLYPVCQCSQLESHPPHKYCLKCDQWRDIDGTCCKTCGTALVLRQLNEQHEPAPRPAFSLDISKHPGVNWSEIVGRQPWITDVHERAKEQSGE